MDINKAKDSIGYLFIKICKSRRNKANEMLARHGIHAGQDVLLYYLSQQDGQTVSELVKNINVQHATISNMLNRMVSNGLITKVKDNLDMRVSRIFLKEKGKEAMKKVEEVWYSLEEQTVEGFSTEEQILLKRLLQDVLKNFRGS
ncbi:MAG TPA: MarR family transcriptional regulator [Draconibacterium sp.]|nr:MarR family transcriptional regulator [Draconibacterium sp.]